MKDNILIHDVIGVGFGPANIAVAIAMEECLFRGKVLFLEARKDATWQENMLFEDSDIQNNPLRDMVTPRNPRSKYSFTNFLHKKDRLFEHLNTNLHLPLRIEFAQYVSWVAEHFNHVTQYNTRVEKVELVESQLDPKRVYKITDTTGNVYYSHMLIVAPGRTPNIPDVFQSIESERVIHLNHFLGTLKKLPAESLKRIAVVGGSQSAVEIILYLAEKYPNSEILGIKRCFGYKQKDVNPFTGEVYFPEFVDLFFNSDDETKRKLIGDLKYTNYSASDADVLDKLYQKIYQQKIQDKQKVFIHRSANVRSAELDGEENVRLFIEKLEADGLVEENVSLVILATGFKNTGTRENEEPYPKMLEDLASYLVLDENGCLRTNYNYSINLKGETRNTCFLNGLCESSHGMGDAGSFSLLALRSQTIVNGIIESRAIASNHNAKNKNNLKIRV